MIDYSTVTETPGDGISREAARMMRERYALTARLARGGDVLEVSCGTGQGLGLIAREARRVVGVDITFASVRKARAHYGSRVALVQGDAERLPFPDGSFDLVAIHEAIYYYPDVDAAMQEAARVLRKTGTLLISTINPEWPDFNPSPYSAGYLNAAALADLLRRRFDAVRVEVSFPAEVRGAKARALSAIKRFAVARDLIPRTMHGKRLLKRLVFGELESVPPEILDGGGEPTAWPLETSPRGASAFKVIYAFAQHVDPARSPGERS
jgi:SAM-dependent methyltransferase